MQYTDSKWLKIWQKWPFFTGAGVFLSVGALSMMIFTAPPSPPVQPVTDKKPARLIMESARPAGVGYEVLASNLVRLSESGQLTAADIQAYLQANAQTPAQTAALQTAAEQAPALLAGSEALRLYAKQQKTFIQAAPSRPMRLSLWGMLFAGVSLSAFAVFALYRYHVQHIYQSMLAAMEIETRLRQYKGNNLPDNLKNVSPVIAHIIAGINAFLDKQRDSSAQADETVNPPAATAEAAGLPETLAGQITDLLSVLHDTSPPSGQPEKPDTYLSDTLQEMQVVLKALHVGNAADGKKTGHLLGQLQNIADKLQHQLSLPQRQTASESEKLRQYVGTRNEIIGKIKDLLK